MLDKFENLEQLNRLLAEFKAIAIDTGLLWKSHYAEKLDTGQRVDRRLLKNINQLGEALSRNNGLKDEVANALIGKFVYLKYLQDRNILTDQWMRERNIHPEDVFSLKATVRELKKLVNALEERFNGKIFPIDFDNEKSLKDEHVKWVAAIFSGAEIVDNESTPEIVLQLHLPFKAYDFEYIPVETLSAIYEQFIFERKIKGAVYTPEALADYLIAEMESVKPLERGMKVLDPACGSGIFLVLIYRLLIEKEIQRHGRKLNAQEMLEILEESNAGFWQKERKFNWIIGNPPWIMLKTDSKKKENKFAYTWMNKPVNKTERPVGDYQIAEAFSWLVSDLLTVAGTAGLLLPTTTLFNIKAGHY